MVSAQICSEIQQHPDFKEALERRMDVLILTAALEMRVPIQEREAVEKIIAAVAFASACRNRGVVIDGT